MSSKRIELWQRHAGHYVKVIERARKLSSEAGAFLDGLSLFDAERGNLDAGQAWAAKYAAHRDDAARAV